MFPARMAKNSRGRPNRRQSSHLPPVGLADDAHAKPGRFQHAAQNRHREARMIDVGVAGDEHDVDLVPAASLCLVHRHRQRGGRGVGVPPAVPICRLAARMDACPMDSSIVPSRPAWGLNIGSDRFWPDMASDLGAPAASRDVRQHVLHLEKLGLPPRNPRPLHGSARSWGHCACYSTLGIPQRKWPQPNLARFSANSWT